MPFESISLVPVSTPKILVSTGTITEHWLFEMNGHHFRSPRTFSKLGFSYKQFESTPLVPQNLFQYRHHYRVLILRSIRVLFHQPDFLFLLVLGTGASSNEIFAILTKYFQMAQQEFYFKSRPATMPQARIFVLSVTLYRLP